MGQEWQFGKKHLECKGISSVRFTKVNQKASRFFLGHPPLLLMGSVILSMANSLLRGQTQNLLALAKQDVMWHVYADFLSRSSGSLEMPMES